MLSYRLACIKVLRISHHTDSCLGCSLHVLAYMYFKAFSPALVWGGGGDEGRR